MYSSQLTNSSVRPPIDKQVVINAKSFAGGKIEQSRVTDE